MIVPMEPGLYSLIGGDCVTPKESLITVLKNVEVSGRSARSHSTDPIQYAFALCIWYDGWTGETWIAPNMWRRVL